jgi:hypothetical protein
MRAYEQRVWLRARETIASTASSKSVKPVSSRRSKLHRHLLQVVEFQRASDGIRTHDLPITNRLHYLCATLAMEGRDKRL